jgi:uncharacterized membrane protein
MIITILQILIIFLIPVIIHNTLNGKAISRWISPVVACYIIGISIGTLVVTRFAEETAKSVVALSQEIEGIAIVIAIPLLLMTSNFVEWLPRAKNVLFAFFISCISVLVGAIGAFFIYRGFTDDGWLVSAMLFAGFTGTNANLNALGIALECPDDLLLLVNLGDMFTGAIYLIVLTSVAHPLLSKILPKYKYYSKGLLFVDEKIAPELNHDLELNFNYIYSYKMKRFGIYILPIILSAVALGISIGSRNAFYACRRNGSYFYHSVSNAFRHFDVDG